MSQDFISPPPGRATFDELDASGRPSRANRLWTAFMDRVFAVCFAMTQSGTTAQRPTEGLFNGRFYWDTTLGKPVWYDSAAEEWVDATGAAA